MERTIRGVVSEHREPHVSIYADCDAAIDVSRPFGLNCDDCRSGFRATLNQQQPDGTICPITLLSGIIVPNKKISTILKVDYDSIVLEIKCLRSYSFGIPFVIVYDHEALETLAMIREHYLWVRRWIESLAAYQFNLELSNGLGHMNADLFTRLPVDATQSAINGDSRLTHPDDVDVNFSEAFGLRSSVITSESAKSLFPNSDPVHLRLDLRVFHPSLPVMKVRRAFVSLAMKRYSRVFPLRMRLVWMPCLFRSQKESLTGHSRRQHHWETTLFIAINTIKTVFTLGEGEPNAWLGLVKCQYPQSISRIISGQG